MKELIFGTVTLDEALFFMLMPTLGFGALFMVAVARGRSRRWLRPSSLGGSLRLTEKHPFEDDYRRPMQLVRWWVFLVVPPMLMLPAVLSASLSTLGRRTSLLDLVIRGLLIGLAVGLGLLLKRLTWSARESE